MSKEDFLKTKLQLLRHIPSTELGLFDARYNPATGELSIDVKFEIHKFIRGGHITEWKESDKEKFLKTFQSKINEYWNDRFMIKCLKPGWTDVVAIPVFSFRKVDSGFHYSIKIAGTSGTSNTAVRTYQTDHDRKVKGDIDYATAVFGAQASDRYANAKSQNKNILDALRLPLNVPVGTHSTGGQFSFPAMSLMQTYAENVNYVFSGVRNKPMIKITGVGSKTKKDADRVASVLKTFRVLNPIKTTSGVRRFGRSAPKGERVVTVEWDNLVAFDAAIPRDYEAIPLASQATIAHEYGHMLGLPDEYNVLCSQSTDFFAENSLIRSKGEGDVHLGNNPANNQNAQSETIAKNQKEFVRLCGQAGIVAPPFGRPNICIMSGGSVFKDYHCITVWEALCKMTASTVRPKDWRIELL